MTSFTLLALYERNMQKINENTNIASGWKYGLYFQRNEQHKNTRNTRGRKCSIFFASVIFVAAFTLIACLLFQSIHCEQEHNTK